MPSLQGNWYAAFSIAATTGMSSSCMERTSTRANATSIFTLDTRAHVAREFQIFPGLAFVRRRSQQIGRMIGHHQTHLSEAEAMHLLAQGAQGLVGAQQILRGDASDSEHDLGLQQCTLLFQI